MSGVGYRYELLQGDATLATGHLSRERPLAAGERIEIAGRTGTVRAVDPISGERELRVVVQLGEDGDV
jgi:hypothetical protein